MRGVGRSLQDPEIRRGYLSEELTPHTWLEAKRELTNDSEWPPIMVMVMQVHWYQPHAQASEVFRESIFRVDPTGKELLQKTEMRIVT